MINYELAKQQGPGLKNTLTRATRIDNPEHRYVAVHSACMRAVRAWENWGAWPDAWNTWQIALDDAMYAANRAGIGAQLRRLQRLEEL